MPIKSKMRAICVLLGIVLGIASTKGVAGDRPQDVALASRIAASGRALRDPWIILAAADVFAKSGALHKQVAGSGDAFMLEELLADAERYRGWNGKAVDAEVARIRKEAGLGD